MFNWYYDVQFACVRTPDQILLTVCSFFPFSQSFVCTFTYYRGVPRGGDFQGFQEGPTKIVSNKQSQASVLLLICYIANTKSAYLHYLLQLQICGWCMQFIANNYATSRYPNRAVSEIL